MRRTTATAFAGRTSLRAERAPRSVLPVRGGRHAAEHLAEPRRRAGADIRRQPVDRKRLAGDDLDRSGTSPRRRAPNRGRRRARRGRARRHERCDRSPKSAGGAVSLAPVSSRISRRSASATLSPDLHAAAGKIPAGHVGVLHQEDGSVLDQHGAHAERHAAREPAEGEEPALPESVMRLERHVAGRTSTRRARPEPSPNRAHAGATIETSVMFRLGHLSDVHLGGVPIAPHEGLRDQAPRRLRELAAQPGARSDPGCARPARRRPEGAGARPHRRHRRPHQHRAARGVRERESLAGGARAARHGDGDPRQPRRLRARRAPALPQALGAVDGAPTTRSSSATRCFPSCAARTSVALIGVSSAVASAPFMATGRVGGEQTKRLRRLLDEARDRRPLPRRPDPSSAEARRPAQPVAKAHRRPPLPPRHRALRRGADPARPRPHAHDDGDQGCERHGPGRRRAGGERRADRRPARRRLRDPRDRRERIVATR